MKTYYMCLHLSLFWAHHSDKHTGGVFNFKCRRVTRSTFASLSAKRPNLKLKNLPKQRFFFTISPVVFYAIFSLGASWWVTLTFNLLSGNNFRLFSDIRSYETVSTLIKVLCLKCFHFLPLLIRPLGLFTQAFKLGIK